MVFHLFKWLVSSLMHMVARFENGQQEPLVLRIRIYRLTVAADVCAARSSSSAAAAASQVRTIEPINPPMSKITSSKGLRRKAGLVFSPIGKSKPKSSHANYCLSTSSVENRDPK